MTEPNDQEAAGMARDLITAIQAAKRGDDATMTMLLGDDNAMLGMAVEFVLLALADGHVDADQWLQRKLEEFREA